MYGARYFGGRYFGLRYFGKTGDTSAGYFLGQHYFGPKYFGRRYFGSTPDNAPFVASVTAGVSGSGTGSLGSIGIDLTAPMTATVTSSLVAVGSGSINATPVVLSDTAFLASAPLVVSAIGTVSFAGVTVELGYTPSPGIGRYFGSRYFGSRYYGPRYWSTFIQFEASVTSGVSATATGAVSASPVTGIEAAITNTLIANGTGSLSSIGIVLGDAISDTPTPPTGGRRRKKPKWQPFSSLPTPVEVQEERERLGILPKKAQLVVKQVVEKATAKADDPKQAALLTAAYTHEDQIGRLERRLKGEFEKANVKLRDEVLGIAQALIIDRLREKADREELSRLVTAQRLEEQEMQEVLDLWLNL